MSKTYINPREIEKLRYRTERMIRGFSKWYHSVCSPHLNGQREITDNLMYQINKEIPRKGCVVMSHYTPLCFDFLGHLEEDNTIPKKIFEEADKRITSISKNLELLIRHSEEDYYGIRSVTN